MKGNRRIPIFVRAPKESNFSYPQDLREAAAEFYETYDRVPSIAEILVWDKEWVRQVLLEHEGRQWAKDKDKRIGTLGIG